MHPARCALSRTFTTLGHKRIKKKHAGNARLRGSPKIVATVVLLNRKDPAGTCD